MKSDVRNYARVVKPVFILSLMDLKALSAQYKLLFEPIRSRHYRRFGTNLVTACCCSIQGQRLQMEDEYDIQALRNHPNTTFIGVYDGYGGLSSFWKLLEALGMFSILPQCCQLFHRWWSCKISQEEPVKADWWRERSRRPICEPSFARCWQKILWPLWWGEERGKYGCICFGQPKRWGQRRQKYLVDCHRLLVCLLTCTKDKFDNQSRGRFPENWLTNWSLGHGSLGRIIETVSLLSNLNRSDTQKSHPWVGLQIAWV